MRTPKSVTTRYFLDPFHLHSRLLIIDYPLSFLIVTSIPYLQITKLAFSLLLTYHLATTNLTRYLLIIRSTLVVTEPVIFSQVFPIWCRNCFLGRLIMAHQRITVLDLVMSHV